MKCASCGTENPGEARFCMSCASPLARTCPSCGSSSPPGARFCVKCAGSLDAIVATAPDLPASLGAGRYQTKSFLGEGSRKRVWLAHDTRLDRDVAVAVIKTEGLDESGLERVRREARAM